MVTLIGLVRTLSVASKPLDCLPYQNRKTVHFRNGWKLDLTFPQFRDVRDSYFSLKKYNIQQLDDDLFEVDFGNYKIKNKLEMICTFSDLLHLYEVEKLGPDFFRIKDEKFVLEGSSAMLFFFREHIRGVYKADVKGKIVLDIGGFNGESTVHFWLSGAKKIVIYEPIAKYCEIIRKNVDVNKINAEIHNAGIGKEKGTLLIDVFTPGVDTKEPYREHIKVENIIEVIRNSGAEVAKIDCEGAESCLTAVPDEVLRQISCYMFELHSKEIERDLTAKFLNAGFKVKKLQRITPDLSIAHFSI